MRTPYDALIYEKAADSGSLVDEYTVTREIALIFGRLLMIGLVLALFIFTGSIAATFLLAAVASLLISLI